MDEKSDEPRLMGQVAAMIAMMSALVKTLPPAARGRLQRQIHAEFESLLSAMAATNGSDAQCDRKRVEWMRDLFLKKIEELNNPQPVRRISRRKAGAARKPAPENQLPAAERPVPKDVDFEL